VPPIDFRKDLNEEQTAAVTAPDGPLFVLAAAGTGKTRTLVHRVAYLVSRGISPERVLLLTFTNRAAREMLERAALLIGSSVSWVWGGTFHHMANRLLRRHARLVGYHSDYTILDRDDSRTLISDSLKERKLLSREFPKPAVLLGLYSAAANTESPLAEAVESRFADLDVDPGKVLDVLKEYRKKKAALGAMDFDDMLVNCLRLLREQQQVLEKYQEQFLHVLVDEYQDTNTLQAEIVDRVAGKNRNLLVVGDDFQSIYSWRGADFRNIMSFTERYADARVCKLETNYRSVPEILEVANACIAGNPEQFQKTLRATRQAYKKPVVARPRDGETQARYVVDQIRQLRRDGCRLRDIALLYRAHFHAMEIQMILAREGIPYVITSGVRFFEQVHIKDVCSVLRILLSPEDEMAFVRLLSLLPGVGARTAAKLWQGMGRRFDPLGGRQRPELRKALGKAARPVWEKIDQVFEEVAREDLTADPGEVIHRFLKAFYESHAVNVFENADRRIDDIRELVLYTAKFESLEAFLTDIALATNLDAETESVGDDPEDALRLTTIHQAKGLEWPVVFILWITEGMFPSARAMSESLSAESEERRLFYVAVTRAKDELFMCMPEVRRTRDQGVIYCLPSRFVEEIPPDLVTHESDPFI